MAMSAVNYMNGYRHWAMKASGSLTLMDCVRERRQWRYNEEYYQDLQEYRSTTHTDWQSSTPTTIINQYLVTAPWQPFDGANFFAEQLALRIGTAPESLALA